MTMEGDDDTRGTNCGDDGTKMMRSVGREMGRRGWGDGRMGMEMEMEMKEEMEDGRYRHRPN